jgi:serine/threonine protein kinase
MDRYTLGKNIGHGMYGTVYEAFDNNHPELELAVKVVDVFDSIGCFQSSCIWEPLIMKQLDHPNIGKILDTYVHEDKLHMIMPRYSIRPDSIDVPTLFKLIHAYSYMERNKVMHRDIKVSNVMLSNNEPVIIDFSLGVICHDIDPAGEREVYPVPYRCPEILLCQMSNTLFSYGWKAEVWALGIFAYRCLMGRYPSIIRQPNLLYQTLKANIQKYRSNLRKLGHLGRVVIRMMEPVPGMRPSFDELLMDSLFNGITAPLCTHITSVHNIPIEDDILCGRIEYMSQMQRISANVVQKAKMLIYEHANKQSISDDVIMIYLYMALTLSIDYNPWIRLSDVQKNILKSLL